MARNNTDENHSIFDTPQFEKFTAAVEKELARLGKSRKARNQKTTLKQIAQICATKQSGVYTFLASNESIVSRSHYEAWKRDPIFVEVRDNVIQLYQEWQTISDAMLMTQRRQEWKDKSYKMAEKLMAKADEMLNAPLFKQKTKTKDGKEVIVLAPAWTVASLAPILAQADKMGRLALEMPSDVTGTVEIPDYAETENTILSKLDKLREDDSGE